MERLEKTVKIDAPVEKVWSFVTEAEHMSRWMLKVEGEIAPGQAFTLTGEPQNKWNGKIFCKVLEMDAPTRLVFSWNHNVLDTETRVEITLKGSGGSTILTLTHSEFEGCACDLSEALADHSAGWDHHLGLMVEEIGKVPA